jgi:hypothetical protein
MKLKYIKDYKGKIPEFTGMDDDRAYNRSEWMRKHGLTHNRCGNEPCYDPYGEGLGCQECTPKPEIQSGCYLQWSLLSKSWVSYER